MTWGALVGVLLGFDSAAAQAAPAQDTVPILARVEDRTRVGPRNRVVVMDPQTGADHEVYRSEGHIPYEAAISADGRYASVLEVVGPTGRRKQRLVVIELSGSTVRLFGESSIYGARGIVKSTWCCGPDKLSFVTGTLGEGAPDEAGSLPTGIFVIDVRSGAETRINEVWGPVQIHWAEFDSSLYIKGTPQVPVPPGTRGLAARPIYRYHVPSGRLSLTTHRGVFFSPDGKYYFDAGVYETAGRSFQLFRTADDQNVTARLAVARHHLGPEGGWMPGVGHVLVFVEKPAPEPPKPGPQGRLVYEGRRPKVYPDRWNVTVDAESGRVIDRLQGDIRAGWKTNAPALPVERRTGVELVLPHRP